MACIRQESLRSGIHRPLIAHHSIGLRAAKFRQHGIASYSAAFTEQSLSDPRIRTNINDLMRLLPDDFEQSDCLSERNINERERLMGSMSSFINEKNSY